MGEAYEALDDRLKAVLNGKQLPTSHISTHVAHDHFCSQRVLLSLPSAAAWRWASIGRL
jgi:hypothetical protein